MGIVIGTKITKKTIDRCKYYWNDEFCCKDCQCSEEECLQNLLDLFNEEVEQ